MSPLRLTALLLMLSCAACQDREAQERPSAPAAPLGPPAYVGVWAAQPDLCGRTVWRFSPTAMVAESGAACLMQDLRPDAGGWTGTVRCADTEPGIISLRLASDPAESLVVEAPFSAAPLTLVRCADPGEPATVVDPHGFLDRAVNTDLRIAARGEDVEVLRPVDNLLVRAVWRADGAIIKISEPLAGGAQAARERDYYFHDGQLFLIRDPTGAFGFVGDRLVTRYSTSGAVLPEWQAGDHPSAASLLRQAATVRRMAESLWRDAPRPRS